MKSHVRLALAAALLVASTAACAQNARSERAAQAMERLKAADADADGYIDRSEADASLPRIAKNFDTLDTDQDGRLSREELQQAMQNARKRFGR